MRLTSCKIRLAQLSSGTQRLKIGGRHKVGDDHTFTMKPAVLSDEDSDSEKEEGLRLLLGGLDISAAAWDNQSEASSHASPEKEAETERTLEIEAPTRKHPLIRPKMYDTSKTANSCDDLLFARAHKMDSNGRLGLPSVCVLDLSHEDRGSALVATKKIIRGQVIYTEQAAMATQLVGSRVRACHFCFRSLEPISSCCTPTRMDDTTTNNGDVELPMKHLWPVMDMQFEDGGDHEQTRRDKYGRVQCRTCDSYYCTQSCYDAFSRQLGSCCKVEMAKNKLPFLFMNSTLSDENDEKEEETTVDVQPSIVLASRMFASALQTFRTSNTICPAVDVLCGESSDASTLELGVATSADPESSNSIKKYTLEPVYNYLVQLWSLSTDEESVLSLELFSSMAAKAARNGFGIRTQSPFRSYYTALLRANGGRCSERHEQVKQQVACALGAKTGVLERGMDRSVDEKVAPEIAGLFLLTSRINHACTSAANAEVHSQEFVDARIDVVAVRNIEVGEEITISYIEKSTRNHRERRQRELRAKYMFLCNCTCCQENR